MAVALGIPSRELGPMLSCQERAFGRPVAKDYLVQATMIAAG